MSHLDLGQDSGYSVLVRDIRVRKAAEAQLRRQARWQTATAEIRLSLLSQASLESSLDLVCKWGVDLSTATAAALVINDNGDRRIMATVGDPGTLHCLRGQLDALADLGVASKISLGTELMGATVPISFPPADNAKTGTLALIGGESVQPDPATDEALVSLASQATLALELATVRSERDRLLITADRERIARDLHDLVIQRLFGAGLRLQGALNLIDNDLASDRVSSTIDDLDTTIKEIREAIFALESAPGTGCRAKILAEVTDATEALGFEPVVSFHGLVDSEIDLPVQLEATAVLREALSNCARHARATRIEVRVTVDRELELLVVDNGVGVGPPGRLSGIANARARAERLGGHLRLTPADGGGTRFDWRPRWPGALSHPSCANPVTSGEKGRSTAASVTLGPAPATLQGERVSR